MVLVLTGCRSLRQAQEQQERSRQAAEVEALLNGYIGHPLREIITNMGPPYRIYPNPPNTLYFFRVELTCRVWFEVDPDGTILQWRYSGCD